jgi:hypothetical protein
VCPEVRQTWTLPFVSAVPPLSKSQFLPLKVGSHSTHPMGHGEGQKSSTGRPLESQVRGACTRNRTHTYSHYGAPESILWWQRHPFVHPVPHQAVHMVSGQIPEPCREGEKSLLLLAHCPVLVWTGWPRLSPRAPTLQHHGWQR